SILLSSDVTVTGAGSVSLPAGAYSIDITYALMGPGTYTITYDRAKISISPTSFSYGSIKASMPSTHGFILYNTGEVDVTISGVTVTDPAHFSVSGLSGSPTITAGGNKPFQVTFSPGTAAGTPYNATITISATSSAQPTSAAITVSGTSAGDPH